MEERQNIECAGRDCDAMALFGSRDDLGSRGELQDADGSG